MFYNGCDYLSIQELTLIYVSKRAPAVELLLPVHAVLYNNFSIAFVEEYDLDLCIGNN